ncbi:hypothetical protein AWENTII_008796 [Aspergillus wentii]|nr:hypothetical protein MW887_005458 [Aspergillus wentii]
MRFTAILLLVATVCAVPNLHHHQRQDNWSALTSALSISRNFSTPTKTANLGNISPPPRSLIPEIISALPASVFVQLVNPSQRSALASEFQAGTTPSWYNSLPTDVKNYMAVVRSQVSAGALTATTGLAYQTDTTSSDPSTTTAESATETAATTSSSQGAAAAAQPTGMVVGGMGALGVLGLAMAL